MCIAGNPKVHSVANIATKLEFVLASDLRPIIYKLELLLTLDQRAVASVYAQAVAEVCEPVSKVGGLARGEIITHVQTGDADRSGWCSAHSVRRHVYVIAVIAKPKIGDQGWAHDIIKAGSNAVVPRL